MAEPEKDTKTMEVVTGGALEALTRGEIESQIDIAKRYPRSMEKFTQRATDMACLDEETAASCLYHRPVGKEAGKLVYADGMSIRMAEIVGACYGNLRVYAMLISQTERQTVARGMAIDLENNFASSSEIIEVTVTSDGKPYSERMRGMIAKAALAKARRDATFQVVPKALAKPIETAVRRLLTGDAKSLDARRKAVAGWIKSLGIAETRVWQALGIAGLADLSAEHLTTLTGLRNAIQDKETSIDDAFPVEPIQTPQAKTAEPKPVDLPRVKKDKPSMAEDRPNPAAKDEAAPKEIEKSQEEIIAECLLWVESCPDEELQKEDGNWLMAELRKVKGTENQLKILRPFNARRQALAKASA